LITYRLGVNSFVICTANVENGQLIPNKKTDAANNNDRISKKEKATEVLEESVVESNGQW